MGWQFWLWLNVGLVPVAVLLVGSIACGGPWSFVSFALRALLAVVQLRSLGKEE